MAAVTATQALVVEGFEIMVAQLEAVSEDMKNGKLEIKELIATLATSMPDSVTEWLQADTPLAPLDADAGPADDAGPSSSARVDPAPAGPKTRTASSRRTPAPAPAAPPPPAAAPKGKGKGKGNTPTQRTAASAPAAPTAKLSGSGILAALSSPAHDGWQSRESALNALCGFFAAKDEEGELEPWLAKVAPGMNECLAANEGKVVLAALAALAALAKAHGPDLAPLVPLVLSALLTASAHTGSVTVAEQAVRTAVALVSAAPTEGALRAVAKSMGSDDGKKPKRSSAAARIIAALLEQLPLTHSMQQLVTVTRQPTATATTSVGARTSVSTIICKLLRSASQVVRNDSLLTLRALAEVRERLRARPPPPSCPSCGRGASSV